MNEEMQIIQRTSTSPVNAFADEGFEISVDMTTAKTSFCSMNAQTPEEKAALYNATNDPDARLSDCINQKIFVKDLYIEVVNCTNAETGEVTPAPRIVIIDKDNKSYQCVSVGIYSALKKMIQIYGVPTWTTPIPVMVKQISKGARKMLTLNIVTE